MRINYKSDFKLNLGVKFADGQTADMSLYDFKVETWCGGKKFTAAHEGTVYKNCKWDAENEKLTIIFDSHGLDRGRLRIETFVKIPDSDFADGTWLKVNVCFPDIDLIDGNGDEYTGNADAIVGYAIISAYNMAVANGYSGTEAEYTAALAGMPSAVENAKSAATSATDAAENAAQTNESVKTAEALRVSAENTRKENEDAMVAAETLRNSAETARDTAEKARAAEFGTLKTASEKATADAETAVENVNTKIGECDAKITEMDETIDEFKIVIVEKANISLSSNQGIDLTGKKIYIKKVSDNTILYTLTWNGSTLTQGIEVDEAYYVEAQAITGYTVQKSDSFTAVSGNSRDITLKYESEKITIHVSAYDNADMSGQIVSMVINGTKTTATWAGQDIVLYVPFGQSVVIYCDKKNGYSTPFTIERTASAASFAANFVYGETKLQVAIVDVNGDTFSPSEWDTADNANVAGFKLTTSNVDIIIAPDYANLGWGPGVLIDGCVTETVDYAAVSDFAGKANTDAITATALTYAAEWTKNYAWKLANKNGYLPALGELYEIALNIDAINECRTAVGLSALNTKQWFWASTQHSATLAWVCYPSSLAVGGTARSLGCCVLAVCAS